MYDMYGQSRKGHWGLYTDMQAVRVLAEGGVVLLDKVPADLVLGEAPTNMLVRRVS